MSDFQKFLEKQLKDPEFKAMWDANEEEKADWLYTLARSIEPARARRRASEAATETEKNFWLFIAKMNL